MTSEKIVSIRQLIRRLKLLFKEERKHIIWISNPMVNKVRINSNKDKCVTHLRRNLAINIHSKKMEAKEDCRVNRS
jgi:hypothetical protein